MSWIKVCSPQDSSTDSYYVNCTNFTFYYHIRTMDFTWLSLSYFLMRIEITWSKVELATFLLLRNALDLFRNVLDRCFIEITLSKVKSISFFLKNVLENQACLMTGLNQASWIFVTGIHTLFMALRIQIPDWEPTQNSAWSAEFKREGRKGKV